MGNRTECKARVGGLWVGIGPGTNGLWTGHINMYERGMSCDLSEAMSMDIDI